jgi:hypothetical protein
MAGEREIKRETDFWGNEKEVIYEDGRKVGEYRLEERGGFMGMGTRTEKVEYNSEGVEVGYSRQEERGGFMGMGTENKDIHYNTDDEEVGHSQVEERGGFMGMGTHHVSVEYDHDGNEISQSNWERRGTLLGMGGERVRVTRYADGSASSGGMAGSGNPARGDAEFNWRDIDTVIVNVQCNGCDQMEGHYFRKPGIRGCKLCGYKTELDRPWPEAVQEMIKSGLYRRVGDGRSLIMNQDWDSAIHLGSYPRLKQIWDLRRFEASPNEASTKSDSTKEKTNFKFLLMALLGICFVIIVIAALEKTDQSDSMPSQSNEQIAELVRSVVEEVPTSSVTVETIGVTLKRDGHWEPSSSQVVFDVDDRGYHGGHSISLQFFAKVRGAAPGSTEFKVDIYRDNDKVGYPYTCIKSYDDIVSDDESRWLAHSEAELIHCPLIDIRKSIGEWTLKLLANGVEIGQTQIVVRKPEPSPNLETGVTSSEAPMVSVDQYLPDKNDSPSNSGNSSSAGLSAGDTGGSPIQSAVKVVGDINSARDFPRENRDLRIGSEVVVQMTVGTDGRARNCQVRKASSDPQADAITCRLAEARFQFRPAVNAAGEPVESIYGWRQRWFYTAAP